MNPWDDPDLRQGAEYVKFDNEGDEVDGQILSIRKHRFDDGSVAPQLLLRKADGAEVTLTAGQIKLKVALLEKRPSVGDHIRVRYTHKERRERKTLKHFDVTVTPGQAGTSTDVPPF